MGPKFEEQAQVSAELLIVIAAVVAVALLFVSSLLKAGQAGRERMDAGVNKSLEKIDSALNQS